MLRKELAHSSSLNRADDTLASRFEHHVIAHQDQPAVATDSGSVTYGQLGAMADSIAAHLDALASRRDEPVCLLMEEGPRLIAAMFGAIKVGRLFIVLHKRGEWPVGNANDRL